MESFAIKIDDADAFDKVLKNSLSEAGDIQIITKDGATVSGAPAVMITFSVRLPDGTDRTAQAVTTVKLLCSALRVLEIKYSRFLE